MATRIERWEKHRDRAMRRAKRFNNSLLRYKKKGQVPPYTIKDHSGSYHPAGSGVKQVRLQLKTLPQPWHLPEDGGWGDRLVENDAKRSTLPLPHLDPPLPFGTPRTYHYRYAYIPYYRRSVTMWRRSKRPGKKMRRQAYVAFLLFLMTGGYPYWDPYARTPVLPH